MIKINKNTKKSFKIPIILFATSAIIVGGLLYLKPNLLSRESVTSNTTKQPSPSTEKNLNSADKSTIEPTSSPNSKTETPNSDNPITPSKSSTDSSRQVVQVVASSNKDSSTLYIRGGVNYPVRDGECTVTLTGPNRNTINKTTPIMPGPASADCKTIQIPLSELTTGKWSFTLKYTSPEFFGESEKVEFNV